MCRRKGKCLPALVGGITSAALAPHFAFRSPFVIIVFRHWKKSFRLRFGHSIDATADDRYGSYPPPDRAEFYFILTCKRVAPC
jgi:hypothetical protein